MSVHQSDQKSSHCHSFTFSPALLVWLLAAIIIALRFYVGKKQSHLRSPKSRSAQSSVSVSVSVDARATGVNVDSLLSAYVKEVLTASTTDNKRIAFVDTYRVQGRGKEVASVRQTAAVSQSTPVSEVKVTPSPTRSHHEPTHVAEVHSAPTPAPKSTLVKLKYT